MSSRVITNEVISASAGTGKTQCLAMRYLYIMACDVAPDRIVALTFSRKAAWEILQRIVRILCGWIASADRFREDTKGLDFPALDRERLVGMLRTILLDSNRLRIGTLDSFFFSVINAFPFEFGLPAELSVIDESFIEQARERVLRRILFEEPGMSSLDAFLQEFQQATYGNAERSLGEKLARFVEDAHDVFLSIPDGTRWGDRKRIWPDGSALLDKPVDAAKRARELSVGGMQLAKTEATREKQARKIEAFMEGVMTAGPHSTLSQAADAVYEKLLGIYPGLVSGRAELTIHQKIVLSPQECRIFLDLVNHLIRLEVEGCLANTRGVHLIMARYEERYNELIRSSGKLTFSDVTRILAGTGEGAPKLSGRLAARDRLYIDYRLDGQFDHWLIDEFQDTSLVQWKAVENLIDEVIQDAGRRSFFYVGDVKQSIYGWRGGEPRLFRAVLKKYGEDALPEGAPLIRSRRSGPEVIKAVNTVFGSLVDEGRIQQISGKTGDAGEAAMVLRETGRIIDWKEHQPSTEIHGHVRLIEAPKAAKGEGEGEEDALDPKSRIMARIILDMKPFERSARAGGNPLSVAVLTRSNAAASLFAEEMKMVGVPTALEGGFAITDDPAVAAFRSMVRLADHPADTFARQHLRMTPFRFLLEERLGTDSGAAELSLELLGDIHSTGFAGTIEKWTARLRAGAKAACDRFAQDRLAELELAARQFDGTGSRNCLEFIGFLDSYRIPSTANDRVVQVMTVHKAKGLGFDVVMLPELDSARKSSMVKSDGNKLREKHSNESLMPEWCLFTPRRDVMAHVPPLDDCLREWDIASCHEAMCVLYVAMTRAARALYMIVDPMPAGGSGLYPSDMVRLLDSRPQAGEVAGPARKAKGKSGSGDGRGDEAGDRGGEAVLYSDGDPGWHKKLPEFSKRDDEVEPRRVVFKDGLKRVTPSGQGARIFLSPSVFRQESGRGRDVGSAVHELMRSIEWWQPDLDAGAMAAKWASEAGQVPGGEAREAAGIFVSAMGDEGIRAQLSKPAGQADLWRERRFDVMLGDRWVSGAFDRVVVSKDRSGAATGAVVLDFKTDVLAGVTATRKAEEYRPQMELYREVLSAILKLAPASVSCRLIFIRSSQVMEM